MVQILIDSMEQLRGLRGERIEQVWAEIESRRAAGATAADQDSEDGLLDAEWQLLAKPTTDRQDDDFRAEVVPVPAGYERLID